MKNEKLVMIAVVVMVVALVLQQSRKPALVNDPMAGHNLVSATEIDQVRELTLKSSQGQIDLKMDKDDWRLKNLHRFHADKNRIEELFQRLHSSKIVEMVSTNSQRNPDLGVASIAIETPITDPDSSQVVLKNAEGQLIKNIYLGKGRQAKSVDGGPGWGNDGQYCRYEGKDQVYLLSTYLWIEKNLKNWLSKQLVKLPSEKIGKIAWSYPALDKEEFEISRASATEELVLNKLPEKMQTKKDVADAAANFFSNLSFDDFIATASPELHPALDQYLSLWVESLDGMKLSMRLSTDSVDLPGVGKMNLLWLTAEYSGPDAGLKTLADELASNSHGFLYALRENKVKPILIKSGNLLEAKPEPAGNASGAADVANLQQVAASHILIAYKGAERSKAERSQEEAKKLVEDLLAKIKKGENFEKLAEENSDCPSGKAKKGSLGEFKRGVMAREFENSAFSLKVGEISEVVKTAFGYHIIRRDK